MMGTIDKVFFFYAAHPKRQKALEKAIEDTQPESSIRKVKDLCRTRWVQRIHALQSFMILHPSIVACMEDICGEGSSEWSTDALTDARALLLSITTTEFLSALVITNSCLSYLTALTSNLQAEAKDIMAAIAEIDNVQIALQSVRDNIDTHHDEW